MSSWQEFNNSGVSLSWQFSCCYVLGARLQWEPLSTSSLGCSNLQLHQQLLFMQHLTLVPSASQFLFRERPSHSYCASHPVALPLSKKERKSMKARINRLLGCQAHPLLLKDNVKFNCKNNGSDINFSHWLLLIKRTFPFKEGENKATLNTCYYICLIP